MEQPASNAPRKQNRNPALVAAADLKRVCLRSLCIPHLIPPPPPPPPPPLLCSGRQRVMYQEFFCFRLMTTIMTVAPRPRSFEATSKFAHPNSPASERSWASCCSLQMMSKLARLSGIAVWIFALHISSWLADSSYQQGAACRACIAETRGACLWCNEVLLATPLQLLQAPLFSRLHAGTIKDGPARLQHVCNFGNPPPPPPPPHLPPLLSLSLSACNLLSRYKQGIAAMTYASAETNGEHAEAQLQLCCTSVPTRRTPCCFTVLSDVQAAAASCMED